MSKEKKKRNIKSFLNPFSGGVSKMKPSRIMLWVLLALLAAIGLPAIVYAMLKIGG